MTWHILPYFLLLTVVLPILRLLWSQISYVLRLFNFLNTIMLMSLMHKQELSKNDINET